jgi:hypothetical protein
MFLYLPCPDKLDIAQSSPYNYTKPCTSRTRRTKQNGGVCRHQCPNQQLVCAHRGQFHTSLAKLGKTPLSDEERQHLAPDQVYGGNRLPNYNVTNPIFLYDLGQMKEEYFWQNLAQFLDVPGSIPNEKYHGSHGRDHHWGDQGRINVCDAYLDDFRKIMMPFSYELFIWLDRFFRPVALDPSRPDVVVCNATDFFNRIQAYAKDPCDRLERLEDGTYELKAELLHL